MRFIIVCLIIGCVSAADPEVEQVRGLLTDIINNVLGNVNSNAISGTGVTAPTLTDEQQQQ